MAGEQVLLKYLDEHNFANWSTDEEGELIDTENFKVLNISEHGIDFVCCGDWQKPAWMRLTFKGVLEVISQETYFEPSEWLMLYKLQRIEDENI